MIATNEKDPLRELFAARPEATLPDGFAARMMERIRREAARQEARRWRRERLLLAVLFALPAVALLVLSVVLKVTLPVPDLRIAWPDLAACRFYFYIGAPVFLLWTADSILRRTFFRSRRPGNY